MIQYIRILEEYPVQLLFAALLFTKEVPKRKFFLIRILILAVPMIIIYDIGVHNMPALGNSLLDQSMQAIPIIYIIFCIWWCNECHWDDALFCGIASAITQNLVYNIYWIIKTKSGIIEGSVVSVCISIPILLIVSSFVMVLFVNRMKEWENIRLNKLRLLTSATAVVVLNIFLTPRISVTVAEQYRFYVAYILTDLLALMLQFGLFNESNLEKRNRITNQLLYEEQKKQKMISENVDLINRKCHDLKHQISALRLISPGKTRDDYIRELEDAVMIYDSAVHTGCRTMDLILMEKLLYCGKHKITFQCMVDGEKINFIDDMDMYSLFGNAIDNAIESVMQIENEEERIIMLKVSGHKNVVNIHLENYTDKIPEFSDGIPVTTKSDKRYHGFGMLSIRHIVEKYCGTINIKMKGNLFCLDIMFTPNNRNRNIVQEV